MIFHVTPGGGYAGDTEIPDLIYLQDPNLEDTLVIMTFFEDWGYIIEKEPCSNLWAFCEARHEVLIISDLNARRTPLLEIGRRVLRRQPRER